MPASGSKQAARAQPKGSLRLLCARITKNKCLTVQNKGRTSSEAFGAEKGIISCAERDAHHLPSRNMPHFLHGTCIGGIWGRKRHHFLRGTGYHLPSERENAPFPARKVPRRPPEQENTPNPARRCNFLIKIWSSAE